MLGGGWGGVEMGEGRDEITILELGVVEGKRRSSGVLHFYVCNFPYRNRTLNLGSLRDLPLPSSMCFLDLFQLLRTE